MLRRSSKRAFSSTTQTLCLPFSAAFDQRGRERRVVRSCGTRSSSSRRPAGPWPRPCTNASTLVANESYGCWTTMSRCAISANRSSFFGLSESPLRERHPRLVLQIGAVERVELADVGEVEQALDRVDAGRPRSRAASRAATASRARSSSTPRAGRRRRSGASAARSRPPRAGRRRRPRSRCRRRGSAGTRRARRPPSRGRARGRKCADHRLEREPEAALADRDEPRQALRAPSRARSAPRPTSGSRTSTPRLSDSPEMYGNGWPGPDRERRQHRVDLAREDALELVELVRRSRRRRCRPGSPRRRARGRARRARAATARRVRSSTRARISASVCCGVRPSGERTARPESDLVVAARRRAP